MLANLQQIPFWLWLIAILVVIGTAWVIIWARRRKVSVTKVEVTTGIVKTTLEPGKQPDPIPVAKTPAEVSVNISGLKVFGKNKFNIRREKSNLSDSIVVGENEFDIGAKPGPKPKSPKGK